MNIATIFSPNWMNYFFIFLYSIFKNNPSPCKIHLLSDEISQIDLNQIEKICNYFGEGYEIKYYNIKKMYDTFMPSGINADSRFSKYVLYKAFLPFIITENRIIFLDGDTLVNGDLSELYNIDLEDNWIGGCSDTGLQLGYKTSIGLKEDDIYINGGSILFDMYKIRESKIADKWVDLLNKKWFACHEQCVFNLTLKNKIRVIDAKYNVSLSTNLNYKDNQKIIIHYAGNKPWNDITVPNYHIWEKYYKEYNSIFQNYKPKNKINKTIAYCWFGKGQKSQLIQNCISSWEKYCSDYEIIEINENNFDINCNKFVSDAYKHKKFAYVADYARMKYMYENGVITLDADVELVRNLNDFLVFGGFSGQEVNDKILITATMGFEKHNPILKMILDYYDCIQFDINNMIPNTQFITKIFEMFIKKKENGKIVLYNDVHIFPQKYFCSYNHNSKQIIKHNDAYAYHLFNGSWLKDVK